ncbi:Acetyl esterase/lipase [Pustulibacterium marinum]|uniref:Acetyl esterase/lipase n=1 Tax=Pustulibacterium marinum TaxID=1224947 RepID=A0A1I7EZJ3_9FLAO|nr:alpha/beta hydrolase [Pustulibacterium marinum]SFU29325.1 Acetyl esterase/lipase [Pustulibacterium marinum]
MKTYTLLATLLIFIGMKAQTDKTIEIWNDEIPNSQKSNSEEKWDQSEWGTLWVTHVQKPTIEVFLPTPRTATGTGVLICPGGGYAGLAYDWEGTDIAKWLNSKGIAAFVLKYRLPSDASVKTTYKAPLQDAQRAMRYIKSNKDQFHLKDGQIGVMGFSAGGHVASTLGTLYNKEVYTPKDSIDNISAKPDFLALIYPVISMQQGVTHQGSKDQLLGKNPSKIVTDEFSNELNVNTETSPTFLIHSTDDGAVPVQNSLRFYQALIANKVPAAMHIFPTGGHGYGLGLENKATQQWTSLFETWITELYQ